MNPFKFCSCYFVESLEVNLFREHKDRVGEGRALYNLGNVFHAKGNENLLGQNCSSVQRFITYTSFISVALAFPWHRPVTDQSDCNGKTALVILNYLTKVDIGKAFE